VNDLSRGELRLGITPPLCLFLGGALLDRFKQRHPAIKLVVKELNQDTIEAAVCDDSIDLGIAFGDALSPDAVFSREIEATEICRQQMQLVVGNEHPYATHSTPLAVGDVQMMEFALLSPEFALRRHVDRYCLDEGIVLNIAFESNSLGLILDAVRKGRYATMFSGDIAQSDGELRALDLVPNLPSRTVILLRRRLAYHRAASKSFTEVALSFSATGLVDSV
jgi:LysR family cyn operon transcriptional activator